MMKKRGRVESKKAQITIFVIVAIVIFLMIMLLFFWPSIKSRFSDVAPQDYLQDCVEEHIDEALALVSKSGGSIEPENYMNFQGGKVEYLCYTNQYYKTCSVQQPLLKQHIEAEISGYLSERANQCFQNLRTELEKRNYEVDMGKGEIEVTLIPSRISIQVDLPLTITKEESTQYDGFSLTYPTQLYDLVMISTSIINYEARYGDSESTIYMTYYPNIRVNKLKQTDGSTVYILSDRDTEDKFVFASRSLAWPGGVGAGETHTPIR